MDKTLDFCQIYYQPDQVQHCYDFATLINNEGKYSDYFENEVIARVVPELTADLIGVASWRLAAKRLDGPTPIILKNKTHLSKEYILSHDFDVAVLTPRSHKDVRFKLCVWHDTKENPAASTALKVFDSFFRIPEVVDHCIYENHFIASREVYHQYVNELLIPAIEFMKERPDVFLADSNYILKKRHNQAEIRAYQAASGRYDWPIAPFILERLFCSFIQGKGLKVISL